MKKVLFASLFAAGLLSACSSPSTENTDEATTQEETSAACMYSYNAETTDFNWTAYKFTEKVGVGGTFEEIAVSGTVESDNPLEVIKGLEFDIPISSINTQNPDRDMKIQKFFFGMLDGTENLSGNVVAINGDETAGTAVVSVMMNEVSRDVEMEYTFENNTFNLSTVIDVMNWNAGIGIDSLNEACYELHTGGDGISKLWPEVKLEIVSELATSGCE
jgi:hypothetical protein